VIDDLPDGWRRLADVLEDDRPWYHTGPSTQAKLPDIRLGEQGQRVGPGVEDGDRDAE
jgi:hypothetical protein